MFRNELGALVTEEWLSTGLFRPNVLVDEFQVMPNHLHAVLMLLDEPGVPPTDLARVIGGFKSATTGRIRELTGPKTEVWQRNYHEHVIPNDPALERIRDYITSNPSNWTDDPENPAAPDPAGFAGWIDGLRG